VSTLTDAAWDVSCSTTINLEKNLMSVSTNLRTDISTMYEYENYSTPLQSFDDVEVSVDVIPTKHPYLPRLCAKQGQVFLWYSTKEKHPLLYNSSQECKEESQWIVSKVPDNIEMAVALIHEYEDEVIIGCVKTAGYVTKLGNEFVVEYLRKVWSDLIKVFGHKRIICPSGSYLEFIHMSMNQKRIPRSPYRRKLLNKFKFVKRDNYWVRDGSNN
jgi:hypothetical protein